MEKETQFDAMSDAFTGEVFTPRSRNHYETNDGIPVAPPIEVRRPTVRERVENLLNRGIDPLGHYVGTEGIDMDVPDEPDAPLTQSEENYLDTIASEIAEQAPLPDEGLPRTATAPSVAPAVPPPAPAGDPPPAAPPAPAKAV